MKTFIRFLLLSFCCIISGAILYGYHQGWFVIMYQTSSAYHAHTVPLARKRAISLYVWQRETWHKEDVTLIWSQDNTANLFLLVRRWLTLLDDEQMIDTPIALQTAMLSPSGSIAYLSFDRTLLPAQASTYTQWHWIEGLLKTIRESGLSIQHVQILVDHQPLHDLRLDFSNPWPITGFITE